MATNGNGKANGKTNGKANGKSNGLDKEWGSNSRWTGVTRPYSVEDVERLRGSIRIEYTLARRGAERLWNLLRSEPYVPALGAMTGNQAIQQVKAGLLAIYVSGWQVAADANDAGQMYPDQSLYPADSVPNLVRHINQALIRADQIHHAEGRNGIQWLAPMIADAEAGFGGNLNAFELMKAMIESGAACVHFEDQLSSAKKCGHLGGKVLVSTGEAIQKLVAARLAADVMGVPTLIMARTDANSAHLLTSDIDPRDHEFLTGNRTAEGFFCIRGGLESAIARGIAYAPYADLIWCETSEPNLEEARRFAEAVHAKYPGKLLAYNCSPSFNWKKKLDDTAIARFQTDLAAMGYKFQFITLAGFHSLNLSMFDLARCYKQSGMSAYARLQETEFSQEREHGYEAVKHQRFVGTGYFDFVTQVIAGGAASTTALAGSTEAEQFAGKPETALDEADRAILSECQAPTPEENLGRGKPRPRI
jgi:isocitrate lyase